MLIVPRADSFDAAMHRLFPGRINEFTNGNRFSCRVFTFQVTENCNLKCTYCYQTHKTENVMPLEIAKKSIDCLFEDNYKIKDYFDVDTLEAINLDFIGGEPLLEIELIDKILEYFIERATINKSKLAYRYRVSLCSNGVLYNTPKVQQFLEKWGKSTSISISLDGCKELHDACRVFPDGKGSYDLAVEAAKDLLEKNPDLDTKMTFAHENLDYIYDAVYNLVQLGYKSISCNCMFEDVWKPGDDSKLYYQFKKVCDYLFTLDKIPDITFLSSTIGKPLDPLENGNWCGGNGAMLAVNYRGEFYPCLRFMESSVGNDVEPYIIGNVDDGIGKTKTQCDKISCLDCITRRSQSTDECFNCNIASGCAWCTAFNYQEFGNPDKRAIYICDMHKARVLVNSYFWNTYYRANKMTERFKIYLDDESCLKIISKEELSMLRQLEKDDF